jgi:hypothetical protein
VVVVVEIHLVVVVVVVEEIAGEVKVTDFLGSSRSGFSHNHSLSNGPETLIHRHRTRLRTLAVTKGLLYDVIVASPILAAEKDGHLVVRKLVTVGHALEPAALGLLGIDAHTCAAPG